MVPCVLHIHRLPQLWCVSGTWPSDLLRDFISSSLRLARLHVKCVRGLRPWKLHGSWLALIQTSAASAQFGSGPRLVNGVPRNSRRKSCLAGVPADQTGSRERVNGSAHPRRVRRGEKICDPYQGFSRQIHTYSFSLKDYRSIVGPHPGQINKCEYKSVYYMLYIHIQVFTNPMVDLIGVDRACLQISDPRRAPVPSNRVTRPVLVLRYPGPTQIPEVELCAEPAGL